jgi:hypothetical protein
VKTTSRRHGYTKRCPFWVQIVQLHVLTGYLGNGHFSVTENWTAPQWHAAWCVVRSASGVSSTTCRILISRGRASFRGTAIFMIDEYSRKRKNERGENWRCYILRDTCHVWDPPVRRSTQSVSGSGWCCECNAYQFVQIKILQSGNWDMSSITLVIWDRSGAGRLKRGYGDLFGDTNPTWRFW